ncbi:hypothetical protein NHQ30_006890 [Ciborinia camelliae]|nr:hypothetical protein NHQ30_006890 [Ciborinia camelliae]
MAEEKDVFSRIPTYHDKNAAYLLPNDSVEQSRLVDQHNGLIALVGQLIRAPVSSPQTVLDVGCGTGVVTRCLSSLFPTAKNVYGIDLSEVPTQAADSDITNLSFLRGNFRKLIGKDPHLGFDSVDFVYSRLLICGMTDWPGYVRDVFSVLKPGGWVEMDDIVENVFYTDNRIIPHDEWEWLRLARQGGALQGLDLDCGLNACKYMEDAGFVDIQTWEFAIPFWRVPNASSELIAEHIIGDKWGLHWHMIPRLVYPLNLEPDKIESLRKDAIKNLQEEEGKQKLFYVTIGRKPTA